MDNKIKTRLFSHFEPFIETLYETDPTFRAVYNFVASLLTCLIVFVTVQYYLDQDVRDHDLELFLWCFQNFHIFIATEIFMHFVAIFILYPLALRYQRHPRGLIISALIVTGIMTWIVITESLPNFTPVLRFATAIEKIRVIMKMASFTRSIINGHDTTYHCENGRKDEDIKPCQPTRDKFIYFLFAPTLIYRDSYPRSPSIRWKKAFGHLARFLIFCHCILLAVSAVLIPAMESFGRQPVTKAEFIDTLMAVSWIAIPCQLWLHIGFFVFYMNFAAELMRFSDRRFNSDYWNSPDSSDIHRRFNLVVHDFIYEVIYVPVSKIYGRYRGNFASFFISSLVHDYVMYLTFGFSVNYFWMSVLVLPRIHYLLKSEPRISGKDHDSRNRSRSGLLGDKFQYCAFMAIIGCWILHLFLYSAEYYTIQNCPDKSMTWMQTFGLSSKAFSCLEFVD